MIRDYLAWRAAQKKHADACEALARMVERNRSAPATRSYAAHREAARKGKAA